MSKPAFLRSIENHMLVHRDSKRTINKTLL